MAVVTIFLLNLLIAQLNQSYHDVFEDMQARHGRTTPKEAPRGLQDPGFAKANCVAGPNVDLCLLILLDCSPCNSLLVLDCFC